MRIDRLSRLYDDPGPFASVLVDVSRDSEDAGHQLGLRIRALREQLLEEGAPTAVVEDLGSRLDEVVHQPAPVSRQLVATERGVLLDEVVHARFDDQYARWDALPDVTRWIALEDGTVPFVLAVVDHEGGDVATYRSDVPGPELQESAGGETFHESKARGTGLSHIRMQNVVENVWKRNAQEVADLVTSHVSRGHRLVLLAGDPKSRSQVHSMLADLQGAEVMELESGSRAEDGGEEALLAAVREAVHTYVVAQRLDVAHVLQDRLGRDDAVATGTADVLDAMVRGQVETVLIDPDRLADSTLTVQDHPGLSLGAVGAPDASVRADLALVAAAAVTGADVAVAGSGVLRGSPAAALLRWDQPSPGSS
jgi:hypothetical protein